MNKTERNLEKLKLELKKFGLNPSEWSIERVQSLYFRIQNKLDHSFTLVGTLEFKNQRPRWKSIELASL